MSKTTEQTPAIEAAVTEAAAAVTAPYRPDAITLDSPIQRGEQTITSVELRKPGAGELRGLKMVDLLQMDVAALQVLLPRISSPTLTVADVAALDPADLLQFGSAVSLFFMTKAEKASLSLPG